MPAVLVKNGDALELSLSGCRGSEFNDAKDKIKEVPGRRWDPERKVWTVPADPQAADRILKTIQPEVDDDLLNWIKESMMKHEESLTAPIGDDAELSVPWATRRCAWQPEEVNGDPFLGAADYQRAAVAVMAERERALLADDMGLGKTFEAITAVEEWRIKNIALDGTLSDGPKLVVCPNSVKGTWESELNRWLDNPSVVIIDGTPEKRHDQLVEGIANDAWIIVNWEQLRIEKVKKPQRNGGYKTVTQMKQPLFETTDWLAVIADEVHRAKSPNAKQSKGLRRVQIKKGNGVQFGLTGTPIMNSPDELWAILAWLWPDQFHERGMAHAPGAVPYSVFFTEYVEFWEDHRGHKVITGVKNPDALRFVLKDKLIRRTASKLGLKGRKRIKYTIPLNPGQQKLYNEAERVMWLAVEEGIAEGNKDAIAFAQAAVEGGGVANLIRIPNGAARLVRLQQVVENAALLGGADDSAVMDDFEEKYDDSRPHQWIVFCKYKESCNLLAARLRKKHGAKVGVYNGDVKPADRTKLEKSFQQGGLDVLVGTIDAMYQGLNLQNANHQHWLTRDFVPAKNEQGESREDRKGQSELVLVYIPQSENTVAANKVDPINRLKEGIVKTVIPQDKIKEATA